MDVKAVCGWAGEEHPELIEEAFNLFGSKNTFDRYVDNLKKDTKRVALYEVVRKLLGKDTPNYAQAIGDCQLADSKVKMADFSTKNIQDVLIGEKVFTHLSNIKTVTRTIEKDYKGKFVTLKLDCYYGDIGATPDHLFIVYDDMDVNKPWHWVKIEDIKIGQYLLAPKCQFPDIDFEDELGARIKVVDKVVDEYEGKVYCLEVEDDHSFICDRIATHNCVSFGLKNAVEYLQASEILIKNDNEEFKYVHPSYFYGISRYQIGYKKYKSNLYRSGDGSVGSWAFEGIQEYGTLFNDTEGAPKYSANVAKDYGRNGPPSNLIEVAKQYKATHGDVDSALVRTVDEAVVALQNYYPITVASNVGFTMDPQSNGYHNQSGSWAHQMCICYFNYEPELHFGILNSWGDSHGTIKDFTTNEQWPIGMLRVKASAVSKMLSQRDSFAIGGFEGFKKRELPDHLFDLFKF